LRAGSGLVGIRTSAMAPPPGARLVIDVSRLMSARGLRATPTGIDRVVAAYARWALTLEAREVAFVSGWRGRHIAESSRAVACRLALIQSLWLGADPEARQPQGPLRSDERRGMGHMLRALVPFSPRAGDLHVSTGHWGLERAGTLARFERAGARNAVFVHDLIPVRFPEFSLPGHPDRHVQRIRNVLRHGQRIIVNSFATRDDLVAFAAEVSMQPPDICVAPLGVDLPAPAIAPSPGAAAPAFVVVGTIEGRKNHALLMTVWSHLIDILGDKTPRLSIVGRRGWRTEAFDAAFGRDRRLVQFVRLEEGLSDQDVAARIRSAVALLSPTFAEGFNLPVMEALAMGALAIISDIPVHRELFGSRASLLSPHDEKAWFSAVLAAMHGARPKAAPWRHPTWDEHFAIVAPVILGMANR